MVCVCSAPETLEYLQYESILIMFNANNFISVTTLQFKPFAGNQAIQIVCKIHIHSLFFLFDDFKLDCNFMREMNDEKKIIHENFQQLLMFQFNVKKSCNSTNQ